MEEVVETPETGNDEGTEGDNETPVTQPETPPVEEKPETTPETPVETPEETVIGSDANVMTVDPMAAVVSEQATVKVTEKNKEESDKTDPKNNVKVISYLGGCVSDGKVVENEDLKFLVRVTAGRKLTEVAYTIDGGAKQTLAVPAAPNAGTDYSFTIEKTAIFSKDADNKTVGKPVAITLETAPISYTVKLSNDADEQKANYKLYAVTGAGDGKLAAAVYDNTGKAAYGESMRFALVPGEGKNVKPASITLNGKEISYTKKELAQEPAAPAPGQTTQADEKTTAYVFTVDTSQAAYGLEQNADADVTVTVVARALSELTVTMTADNTKYSYAESATNTAAASFIKYTDGTGFAKVAEESDDLSKSLAFQVKPAAGLIVDEVTAKVGAKDVTVTVTDVTGKDDKECTIALNQLDLTEGNVTLVVTVETALKEGAEGTTKITFTGVAADDLSHAEYTAAAESGNLSYDEESVKNTYLVKREDVSDAYYIQVAPKAGYELAKSSETDKGADDALIGKDKQIVTVKETRKIDGETDPATVTYVAEAYADDTAKPILLTLHKEAVADPAAKAYDVTAVEVKIGTVLAENPDEKKVKFTGDLLDSVTITNTTGVVLINDETEGEKTYAIAEGVNSLAFSVKAAAEPAVEVDSTPVKGTAAEGSYSYSIPTMSMADSATITVSAAAVTRKAVKVKLNTDALSVEDGVQITVDGEEGSLVDDGDSEEDDDCLLMDSNSQNPVVGSKVSMKLAAVPGCTFKTVTYTVKGSEAKNGTISADKTTATVDFTVTDEVQVVVETESHWHVVLGGVSKEGSAYKADCNVENITAELYCGNERKTLQDVIVMDGKSTAATKAVIVTEGTDANKVAKIAKIDPDEYGKTLTIKLSSDGEYYDATLEVGAASTGVTVKMNGKAVTEEEGISMSTDAEVSLEVSAVGEKANVNDLKAEIAFEKKGEAAVTGTVAGFFAAGASVNTGSGAVTIAEDGSVVLKTAAVKEAPKDNVFLVISSKIVKDDKDNTKDKVFAKIPINITGPVVLSDAVKEVTAAAAPSSNREVRLNLGLEFADKKNPPKAPLAGDLYYKVELTKVEGDAEVKKAETAGSLTLIDAADRVKYVKIGSYAAADLAKFVEFDLVKSYKDAQNQETDGDLPGIITVEAKVTLVQSLAAADLTSASAATDYVANDAKAKEVKEGLVTRKPVYETKLSVKTLNGATVFTGQQKVTVAKPNFSKDTTCDEITVQFVNSKTGKILSSGKGSKTSTASYNNFTAGVNEDNSVWVSSAYQSTCAKNIKDLGVKVTAHAENDEYRASAVVKLKIQQGIYQIDTDESKAALPTTLYRDAKGAVKSVKIATVLNQKDNDYKPAKANLTWEITDADGDSVSSSGCDLDANIKKALTKTDNKGRLKPDITVKNGTVSVAKTYQYVTGDPDANTFWVNAKAADFAGNDIELDYAIRFVISEEQQVIGSLAVVGSDGTPLGEVSSDKNGAVVTLKAETMIEDYPQIVALKPGAKLVDGCYDLSNDTLPATFSISGKLVTLDKQDGASMPYLVFNKPGDKITVTAKVVDGSKAKDVKMTLNVKPFEQLGLRLTAANGTGYEPDRTEAITYSGSSNERYELALEYYSEYQKSWQPLPQYKGVKVEVKDGKLVANKDWAKDAEYTYEIGRAVVVAAGKDQAVITLKDTGARNAVKNTYTIKAKVNTKNLKAAKIKMKSPTKMSYRYSGGIVWQTTDQDKKTKEYIYAGKYVKLAPDFTVAKSSNSYDAYDMLDHDGEYFRIDENGRFETWLSSAGSDSNRYLAAGSYKMIATVGDIVDGEFVPVTKDTKLSFNVPKAKTSNTSLNVTAGYKLDEKSAAKATLVVKSNYSYQVFNAKNEIKKNDQKLGDHSNHFTDFFEVKRYAKQQNNGSYVWKEVGENAYISTDSSWGYATIGLKDNLTVEQIKYITGTTGNKETDKAAKADRVGYITVDNGFYRKDVKITISFSELKKYTAKADPLFENSAAIKHNVYIYNGKNYVPVLYAAIDETGKNDLTGLTAVEKDGYVELTTAATGIKPGKHTVTLKVVPASAAVMKADAQAASALDKAAMLKDYAIPAELKLEVKELAKAQKTLKTGTKVKLSSYAYNEWNNNGYQIGAAGKYGSYIVNVPYSLTAENINVDTIEVTLANNTVTGTEKKLVEAAKETATVWNSITDDYDLVPVIKLTVNKEALEKAVDSKGKHLYYGKTLKVPVKITYKNQANAAAEETVTYSITIPKRPAATYDKEALKTKAAKIFVTIDEENPQYTIDDLYGRLYEIVASFAPADTDYVIQDFAAAKEEAAPAIEGDDASDPDPDAEILEIVKTGKAVISFKIKNNATTEAAEQFTFTYDLGIKPGTVGNETVTLAALKTEITNALNDPTKVAYAKDKSAEAVMSDLSKNDTLVKKVLDDAKLGRKNYSIKASVKHNPATKTSRANMVVTVEIRNLTRREQVDDEWVRLVTVTITITDASGVNLNGFDQAYSAVKTFFDTQSNITGIVDDCSGQPGDIWTAIENAAKEKVNNPGITVTVENKDYVAPSTEGEGASATNKPGHIQFTIKLEENGRVRNWKSAKITIAADNVTKYAAIATVEADVTKAFLTTTTKNDKLKEIAAGTGGNALNDSNSLKAAIETAIGAIVTKKPVESGISVVETSSAKYLGYLYEIKDWTFTAATKKADASLEFDLVLTSKGNAASTKTIEVSCTDLIGKANKYQTLAELKDEIEAVTEVEVTTAPTAENYAATLKTELEKYDNAETKRTITLVTEGDGITVTFTAATDEAPATVAGLKATITQGSGENAPTETVALKTITFKVVTTTPPAQS